VQTLTADCKVAVMNAFWTSAALGSIRSKWYVTNLTYTWQVLWAGVTIFLIWVPLMVYHTLLTKEWNNALKSPSADVYRLLSINGLLLINGLLSALTICQLCGLKQASPSRRIGTIAALEASKGDISRFNAASEELDDDASRAEVARRALETPSSWPFAAGFGGFDADRFAFQFTDARLHSPTSYGSERKATGYAADVPPRPRRDGASTSKVTVEYLPLLKI
jgi:hypothetical protein